MRRALKLIALTLVVKSAPAWAGPNAGSGPITVDSTTFVAGQSVMGTDGGVYSDTLPPVASTTTAAFRMTKYRAEHVNLRDSSGVEIGTSGNPLFTTASSTITIGNVTITNSSFSVTGSTVTIAQPTASSLNATVVQSNPLNLQVSASLNGSSNTVKAQQSGTWNVNATAVNVGTVTISGTPSVSVSNSPSLGAGSSNIGTVTGSSITIPGTVNTRSVSVSTVIVSAMPSVTVNLSTVTITNSSFSIVGVSSVTIVNHTLTVQLTGATPAGANNIGTVSGSSVTVNGSVNATLVGSSNVNIASMPAVTQPVPGSLKTSVYIAGSSNTVQAQQSGTWTMTSTSVNLSTVTFNGTAQPVNVMNVPRVIVSSVSVLIDGSSNTVKATQNGTWNVNASPIGTSTVTFNGSAQPVYQTANSTVTFNGVAQPVTAAESGTWNVNAYVTNPTTATVSGTVAATQSGTWGVNSTPVGITTVTFNGSAQPVTQSGSWINTVTQATPANLQASVSINGSSNTVAATQSGSWTNTVQQTTPASLQASVSINGSSNTVAAAQSGTWTVQPGNTQNSTPWLMITTATVNTSAAQSGAWTNTVTQGTNSNLRASVTIDGSSNTVAATQSGAWTDTVIQSGTRWQMGFSTTTTTAVLSSTGVTSSVAISTPIAGLSSQTVRVFRIMLSADAATTITFRDGSTNFGDSQYLAANGSIVLDLTNEPWYITSSSNGFVIKQSGSANIGVRIWYTQS